MNKFCGYTYYLRTATAQNVQRSLQNYKLVCKKFGLTYIHTPHASSSPSYNIRN